MKCASQYPLTSGMLRALRVIVAHAKSSMPQLRCLLGDAYPPRLLNPLVDAGYVERRIGPPNWLLKGLTPYEYYAVTEEGYAAHEYHARQSRCTIQPEDRPRRLDQSKSVRRTAKQVKDAVAELRRAAAL